MLNLSTLEALPRETFIFQARITRISGWLAQTVHDITCLRPLQSTTAELLRLDKCFAAAPFIDNTVMVRGTAAGRVYATLKGVATNGLSFGTMLGRMSRSPVPNSSVRIFLRLARAQTVLEKVIEKATHDGKVSKKLSSIRSYGAKSIDGEFLHELIHTCRHEFVREAASATIYSAISRGIVFGSRLVADATIRYNQTKECRKATHTAVHAVQQPKPSVQPPPLPQSPPPQDTVFDNDRQLRTPEGTSITTAAPFDDTASSCGTSTTTTSEEHAIASDAQQCVQPPEPAQRPRPSSPDFNPHPSELHGLRLRASVSPPRGKPARRCLDMSGPPSQRRLIYNPDVSKTLARNPHLQSGEHAYNFFAPGFLASPFKPNPPRKSIGKRQAKRSCLPRCASVKSDAAAKAAKVNISHPCRPSRCFTDEPLSPQNLPRVSRGQLIVAASTLAGTITLYQDEPNPTAMAVMDHWVDGVVTSCTRSRVKIYTKNLSKTFGIQALTCLKKLDRTNVPVSPGFTIFAGTQIGYPEFSALAKANQDTTTMIVKNFQTRHERAQHTIWMHKHSAHKHTYGSKHLRRRRRSKRKAHPHASSDPTAKRR